MGLLTELGITNPTDVNLDEVENQMRSGGLPPEGIHHAIVDGVGPIPNADGRGWKFTFEIIAGPGKGAKVEDVLWKPKGDDAGKDKKVQNRILMFAHRLGLLKKVKGDDGKEKTVEVEGKSEFAHTYGVPCFIEIHHEDEEYEKNGKKHTIKKAKLTFGGLIAPDDKRVKDVPKAATVPVMNTAGKPVAKAGEKKDQFADL